MGIRGRKFAAHVGIDEVFLGRVQLRRKVVVGNAQFIQALGFFRRQRAEKILSQMSVIGVICHGLLHYS